MLAYMETMTTEQKILFVNQIEFCYGNIEWTHKIHEKCADIYTCVCNILSWLQLILSFIVGWDVLSQMRSDSPIISWVLVICSGLLALILSISKTFNFEKIRDSHIATAKSLWDLRETYRSFKTDIQADLYTVEEFTAKRDQLQMITSEIYKKAPRTFDRAYNKAKQDFEEGKTTFDHTEV